MALWKWQGTNREGKEVEGESEVKNVKELRRLLRIQGIRLKSYVSPSILNVDINKLLVERGLLKPFGNKELAYFTEQLSILIEAGVPILQSLDILVKQEKNPSMKLTIQRIKDNVSSGKTLSAAMRLDKGFSKLYCNLVRAGEESGILDQILLKLTGYLNKSEDLKKKIKSAMTYPGIVTIVGVAVIYAMLTFVVPEFTSMLNSSGQKIPDLTQFVIDMSDWLKNYSYIVFPSIIVSAAMSLQFIKSPVGKPIWDRFVIKLPVFGQITILGNLGSFTQTLSTLISSGISLVDSLEICIETLDNSKIARDITFVRKQVVEGSTLADPLLKIPYFPEMISQMVKVGEQTGNLDNMLLKVGQVFERNVDSTISTLTTLIEPIVLVLLGGIVGFILIAMYLPIFMSANTV